MGKRHIEVAVGFLNFTMVIYEFDTAPSILSLS